MIAFSAETYQNEYLPAGGTDVSAIVGITAHGSENEPPTAAGSATEILVVDVSGSMVGHKMAAVKQAAKAAVECLRDGVVRRDRRQRDRPPGVPARRLAARGVE